MGFNNPWIWIGIPTICYAVQSIRYYFGLHRFGMCLTFAGYCIANVGLIIDEYEQYSET
jgi:hypothetical protein